jgi:methylthioribose-1-phosphate isomerase
VRAVNWSNDHLRLLDQRQLPQVTDYLEIHDVLSLGRAIREMAVRGAPAIGIAAAYGVVLSARSAYRSDPEHWRDLVEKDMRDLAQSRPTAVNLQWALERMRSKFDRIEADPVPVLLAEAMAIHEEDITANRHMGALGAALIGDARHVLTHCNTGSLATGGYGTALGVIRSAFHAGSLESVYATETRPWLQGARLTAWELQQDGIPVTLIADSAVSFLLKNGEVSWVVVGADRIAANGDAANKIGTYGLAVAARHHGISFMVVAPASSIDLCTKSGDEIPIEDRGPDEILHYAGIAVAPAGVAGWNPVFDITPAELIDVIVTEKGIVHKPDRKKIMALFDKAPG